VALPASAARIKTLHRGGAFVFIFGADKKRSTPL